MLYGENSVKEVWLDRGMMFAIASAVLWGLVVAASKVSVTTLQIPAVLFSSMMFFYAGIVLIFIGRKGATHKETLKSWHTWAYGGVRLIDVICFNLSLLYITATEAILMQRTTILFAIFLSYFAFKRTPSKADIPGLLLILIGCSFLIVREGGFESTVVWLIGISALGNAIRALLIEAHPESNKALGLRARCRYTGVVVFVSSIFTLVGLFILNQLQEPVVNNHVLGEILYQTSYYNPLEAFLSWKLHIASFVVGGLFLAPTMYVIFYAIRLINADNLLMVGALIPFASMAFESLFSLLGWLDMSTFDVTDMAIGVMITLGAMLTFVLRMYKKVNA